ncbi:hypothetical protein GQ44DRAFT_776984 [Phaeosphaeriaceae sp. PMI808]|nr:hypothetical protein GQ44DRAFT_776984 [Phaeosphaeriaceae sp. PMI808]
MAEDNYSPAAPGDFFCPAGGTWYACQTGTNFIGCCTSDPCGTGCFGDRLRPVGVSTTIYNKYPGGTCGGNTPFWTCMAGPTFWGCCNSDPCKNNSTCSVGNLEPAFMTRPDQIKYFGALNVLLSSTVPSIISSATSLLPVSETASGSPASTLPSSPSKVSSAIIGGAVGGAVVLLGMIGVVIFFLCRRRRRRQKSENGEAKLIDKSSTEQPLSPELGGNSPPPAYSHEHQSFPHSESTTTNHIHLKQWSYKRIVPQELPTEYADMSTSNRYSELPAQTTFHRLSELPAGATRLSELESPLVSPQPPQTDFPAGVTGPSELESPEVSPRPPQTDFPTNTTERPPQGLCLTGVKEDLK